MFGDLAVVLSKVGVAPSTNATDAAAWKMWVNWRQDVVKRRISLNANLGGALYCGRDLEVLGMLRSIICNFQEGLRFRRLMRS